MKGTAISAEWLGDIQQAKEKLDDTTKNDYEKIGITFNEWLILMPISPICYNNLKSLDVNNVRTCVGMFLFHEISYFMV